MAVGRRPTSHQPMLRRDAAVSSMVGTILMIGITVTVFSGVAVVVMSEAGETQDNQSTRLSAESRGTSSLILSHNGGESVTLAGGTISMVVEGQPVALPLSEFADQTDNQEEWTIGDSICIVGAGAGCKYPQGTDVSSVQVISKNHLLLAHGDPTTTSAGLPNLVPVSMTSDPTAPFTGNVVTFNVTISNTGTADVLPGASFDVVLLIDSVESNRATVAGPITQGTSIVQPLNWTSTVGTHTVDIVVDDGHLVTELDEADNTLTDSITATASPQPDLTPKTVTINPSSPTTGDTVTFTVTVANDGNADVSSSQSFTVKLLVDAAEQSVSTINGPLVAGFNTTTQLTWSATGNGAHTWQVVVDAGGSITESVETNNDATGSVTVGTATKPDLEYYQIVMLPSEPNDGDNVRFWMRLDNAGNADIPSGDSWQVRLYEGSTTLDTVTLNGPLAVGGITSWFYLEWTATAGTHYLGANLDSNDDIDESDESDNVATGTITISGGSTADPGQAFHDRNGNGVYDPGTDALVSNSEVQDGVYDAGGDALVIPPSVGKITANRIDFKGDGVTIKVDLEATGDDLKIDGKNGNVDIRNVKIKVTANDKDIEVKGKNHVYADGAELLATANKGEVLFDVDGHIYLRGAEITILASNGKAEFKTKANIYAENGVFKTQGNKDTHFIVDDNDGQRLYASGAEVYRFRNGAYQAGTARAYVDDADDEPGTQVQSTPSIGSLQYYD